MIAKHYGRSYSLQNLRERSFITREGVSMLGISDAAESIGMHTMGVRITLKQLLEEANLPCILHWNQKHFVVLYASSTPSERGGFSISLPFGEGQGGASSLQTLRVKNTP
jgi:ATP-binding cassette subfamily B protein